jgi:hypothetical protein
VILLNAIHPANCSESIHHQTDHLAKLKRDSACQ